MKLLVVFCLVAAAYAAPPGNPEYAEITKYTNDNTGTGPFVYEYVSSDGTKVSASGDLKSGGTDKEHPSYLAIKGSYEYVGSDGVTYTTFYEADENGYRPQLTQGPGGAIPEEVVKTFSH